MKSNRSIFATPISNLRRFLGATFCMLVFLAITLPASASYSFLLRVENQTGHDILNGSNPCLYVNAWNETSQSWETVFCDVDFFLHTNEYTIVSVTVYEDWWDAFVESDMNWGDVVFEFAEYEDPQGTYSSSEMVYVWGTDPDGAAWRVDYTED
ncbi:MAG: hypothetical protein AB1705_19340 [Verrucomicrobiota bacterium]